jgi:hypothetical protein
MADLPCDHLSCPNHGVVCLQVVPAPGQPDSPHGETGSFFVLCRGCYMTLMDWLGPCDATLPPQQIGTTASMIEEGDDDSVAG